MATSSQILNVGAAWSHTGFPQLEELLPGMQPRQRAAVGVGELQRAAARAMPSRYVGTGPTPTQIDLVTKKSISPAYKIFSSANSKMSILDM